MITCSALTGREGESRQPGLVGAQQRYVLAPQNPGDETSPGGSSATSNTYSH
jgi:hypothetical protein